MPADPDEAKQKPVIFLAFANDRVEGGAYLRNLPNELDGIRRALQKAKQDGLCEVVERTNTTVEHILDVFQEYPDRIAIFHYGGHADSYELLLESLTGEHAVAHSTGLVSFLAKQKGLQLIFLNGCCTQQQALDLVTDGVPAVIGTSQKIDDEIATDLSVRFYKGLAAGYPIERAWKEAEDQIKIQKGATNFRALYWQGKVEAADRFPWQIYHGEGANKVKQWNLPGAANSPLFGLPPIPSGDLPPKPYRHLHRFTRKDAEIFFGRDPQIRELYNLVTTPHSAPIILLYGQSGVGKSSFLEAGLLPRLETSHVIRYCRRHQELGLLATLQQELTPDRKDLPFLQAWHTLESERQQPLVLILDQVEEVFTRPNEKLPDELPSFWQALKATFANAAQRPKGKLILGFRKEWLAEIEKRLNDHELFYHPHFLEPLDRNGIIEAICSPAKVARLQQQYGLRIAAGLPEIIADSLLDDRDSPLAPMLQILLTKMWDQATQHSRSHPIFDHALYNSLRKPKSFLQHFLLDQLEALRRWRPEVVDSGLALDILYFHTTPDGTAQQRTAQETERVYGHRSDVLPDLIWQSKDLYLLVDPAADQPDATLAQATRLTHDTLAPLVRKLFNESDKPGQRAARVLSSKLSNFRPDEALLDGNDLDVVGEGKNGMRQLTDLQQGLVTQSQEQQRRSREIMERLKYSQEEVEIRLRNFGYYDSHMNSYGKGIVHEYQLQKFSLVVYDGTTKLYWQQSGSSIFRICASVKKFLRDLGDEMLIRDSNNQEWAEAEQYILDLNNQQFNGYDDWRLPTLEEAMSLMEPTKKNGDLHIDPVFDRKQTGIWTASKTSQEQIWCVNFEFGQCDKCHVGNFYVRAVRSGQSSIL